LVHQINPLTDERWPDLVRRHPRAAVFHTREWLQLLSQTYGYQPIAITTSAPGEVLQNGVVFCRIRSWLTGRRLVSLPFSDHCDPLIEHPHEVEELMSGLKAGREWEKSRYIEIRPLNELVGSPAGFTEAESFCFHMLDLRPGLDDIFRRFHKDCVQRKVRRAEREGLSYEQGRSDSFIRQFYSLLMLSSRRHHVPPQPINWFRNMMACLGENTSVHLVSKAGQPVASILTLRHKDTLVYKYGGSDLGFSNLGGMQFLFWKAIQGAKDIGLEQMDLGRSDLDNEGLIDFKDRFGADRSTVTYWRYPNRPPSQAGSLGRSRFAKQIFAGLPDSVLTTAGKLLYRHMG
jgi:hypothetical protein